MAIQNVAAFRRLNDCRVMVQCSSVAQSCSTLCDPMDGSLPGSSVHGIFQTTVLEWVAISFSTSPGGPDLNDYKDLVE